MSPVKPSRVLIQGIYPFFCVPLAPLALEWGGWDRQLFGMVRLGCASEHRLWVLPRACSSPKGPDVEEEIGPRFWLQQQRGFGGCWFVLGFAVSLLRNTGGIAA